MNAIKIRRDGSIEFGEVESGEIAARMSSLATYAAIIDLKKTIGDKNTVYIDGNAMQIDGRVVDRYTAAVKFDRHLGWVS